MGQLSFTKAEYANRKRRTKKEDFLDLMDEMLGPGEISQNGSGENRQKLVKKKSPMYQKIDENYLLV